MCLNRLDPTNLYIFIWGASVPATLVSLTTYLNILRIFEKLDMLFLCQTWLVFDKTQLFKCHYYVDFVVL